MSTEATTPHAPSTLVRFGARRSVQVAAFGTATVLAAATVIAAGGGAAGASTTLSRSTGRFLSGTVAGTTLDTVAGIDGESAKYPTDPGPNANDLNAELGGTAIPIGDALHLPDPSGGAIKFGAVAQYARAKSNGSALGASGAIDDNGGIAVGGSNGVPKGGATIDLTGSTALSAITSAVGDLKLTIGALSSRAKQVSRGKSEDDPSADCTSGGYSRVGNDDQAGTYNIGGLSIDLTSPLLSTIATTLDSALGTVLTTSNASTVLGTILSGLPAGVVTISGLPTDPATFINHLLTLSLADGAITVNLVSGAVHIDLAGVLSFLGLDINNLCPNTSILPFISRALTGLPAAITALEASVNAAITNALGDIAVTVTVAPLPPVSIAPANVASLVSSLTGTATGAVTTLLDAVSTSALTPIFQILSDNLLDLIGNAQAETSDDTFEIVALQLNVLPNAGAAALPTIPGLPAVPGLPAPASLRAAAKAHAKQAAAAKKAAAARKAGAKSYTVRLTKHEKATIAKAVVRSSASTRSLSVKALKPLDTVSASTTVVQLNLAGATVGPNAAPSDDSSSPEPSASISAVSSALPTAVPAGLAPTKGAPALPFVLGVLAMLFAGVGAFAFRLRHRHAH